MQGHDSILGLLNLIENCPAAIIEGVALGSHAELAGGALKQTSAKAIFQPGNQFADGGRCQIQLSGCR